MILILQIALAIVLAYLIIVFFPVILTVGASLIGLALVVLFLSVLIYGAYYLFTNTNLDFLWEGLGDILFVLFLVAITLGIIFFCWALFASTRDFFKHARKREYTLAAIWFSALLIFIMMLGN